MLNILRTDTWGRMFEAWISLHGNADKMEENCDLQLCAWATLPYGRHKLHCIGSHVTVRLDRCNGHWRATLTFVGASKRSRDAATGHWYSDKATSEKNGVRFLTCAFIEFKNCSHLVKTREWHCLLQHYKHRALCSWFQLYTQPEEMVPFSAVWADDTLFWTSDRLVSKQATTNVFCCVNAFSS